MELEAVEEVFLQERESLLATNKASHRFNGWTPLISLAWSTAKRSLPSYVVQLVNVKPFPNPEGHIEKGHPWGKQT